MDIPPEAYDAAGDVSMGGDGGGSGGATVCPHCTFENSHSDGDCDICGLPLV